MHQSLNRFRNLCLKNRVHQLQEIQSIWSLRTFAMMLKLTRKLRTSNFHVAKRNKPRKYSTTCRESVRPVKWLPSSELQEQARPHCSTSLPAESRWLLVLYRSTNNLMTMTTLGTLPTMLCKLMCSCRLSLFDKLSTSQPIFGWLSKRKRRKRRFYNWQTVWN